MGGMGVRGYWRPPVRGIWRAGDEGIRRPAGSRIRGLRGQHARLQESKSLRDGAGGRAAWLIGRGGDEGGKGRAQQAKGPWGNLTAGGSRPGRGARPLPATRRCGIRLSVHALSARRAAARSSTDLCVLQRHRPPRHSDACAGESCDLRTYMFVVVIHVLRQINCVRAMCRVEGSNFIVQSLRGHSGAIRDLSRHSNS